MKLANAEVLSKDGLPDKVVFSVDQRLLSAQAFKDLLDKLIKEVNEVRDQVNKKKFKNINTFLKLGKNVIGAEMLEVKVIYLKELFKILGEKAISKAKLTN